MLLTPWLIALLRDVSTSTRTTARLGMAALVAVVFAQLAAGRTVPWMRRFAFYAGTITVVQYLFWVNDFSYRHGFLFARIVERSSAIVTKIRNLPISKNRSQRLTVIVLEKSCEDLFQLDRLFVGMETACYLSWGAQYVYGDRSKVKYVALNHFLPNQTAENQRLFNDWLARQSSWPADGALPYDENHLFFDPFR